MTFDKINLFIDNMAALNFRKFGEGEPLIIMHGLYGSSDNWVSIARVLMDWFTVYILDMRNHGASPHLKNHNYDAMVGDLEEFMNSQQLYSAVILGHSMGGKAAMFFTATFPERVKKLIVVDISPRTYQLELGDQQGDEHRVILSAIKNLSLDSLLSRDDAIKELRASIKSEKVLQFLMKNLRRDKSKKFYWKINVEVLLNSLSNILAGLEDMKEELHMFSNKVLFIKGGNSHYIRAVDIDLINDLFSNASIKTIDNASHWVHAENPYEFIDIVKEFVLS